jgi:hypothetical protein
MDTNAKPAVSGTVRADVRPAASHPWRSMRIISMRKGNCIRATISNHKLGKAKTYRGSKYAEYYSGGCLQNEIVPTPTLTVRR